MQSRLARSLLSIAPFAVVWAVGCSFEPTSEDVSTSESGLEGSGSGSGSGSSCNASEQVDGCSTGIVLPTAAWVDQHNAQMDGMIGKTGIEPEPAVRGCFAHYEKSYSTRSVTKEVLMGSAAAVMATKVTNGWENKALLKSCGGRCEATGRFKSVLTPNVANVVDCGGKAIAAVAAVYEVVKTYNDLQDNGCLVQIKNYHRNMKVVAATGCETSCTLESSHACNSCGGTELDRTTKTLKSAKLERGDGYFQHDTFRREACEAETVPHGDPGSPYYQACGADCTGQICMKASCGGKNHFYCAKELSCWNLLNCQEAARTLACGELANETCDTGGGSGSGSGSGSGH